MVYGFFLNLSGEHFRLRPGVADAALLPVRLRGNPIAAHDLLQGLTLKAAGFGCLGDVAAVEGQHVPDIGGIEGPEIVFLGGFVRQVEKWGDLRYDRGYRRASNTDILG